MVAPSVLFLGGTGIISSACTERALAVGMEVFILNRGRTSSRPVPEGAQTLVGDADDPDSLREAVGSRRFDVVADFRAFTPAQVQSRLDIFGDRMGQYVFISSASAYQTPPGRLPVVESSPLRNPFWQYPRDKIACEDLLVRAYREQGFPMTIVRPSHTYDKTLLPFDGGWTVVDRMRRGVEVVVPGDGTSLWTLTHHRGLRPRLRRAAGSSRRHRRQLPHHFRRVAAVERDLRDRGRCRRCEAKLVHVPSDAIAAVDPE